MNGQDSVPHVHPWWEMAPWPFVTLHLTTENHQDELVLKEKEVKSNPGLAL